VALRTDSDLCSSELRLHGWVPGGKKRGVIGKFRQAAHPPFRTHHPSARNGLEHLIDGELEAEISTLCEISHIQESIDNDRLSECRTVDLFDECFGLHGKSNVQVVIWLFNHVGLVGVR